MAISKVERTTATSPEQNSQASAPSKTAVKMADVRKVKTEEMDKMKASIFNVRDYLNSLIGQVIRLGDAHRRFHYVTKVNADAKDKIGRDQDARVQTRAEEDWGGSAQAVLMYLKRIGEELHAADKTIRG